MGRVGLSRQTISHLWVIVGCGLLVAAAAVQFGTAAALVVGGIAAVAIGLFLVDVDPKPAPTERPPS